MGHGHIHTVHTPGQIPRAEAQASAVMPTSPPSDEHDPLEGLRALCYSASFLAHYADVEPSTRGYNRALMHATAHTGVQDVLPGDNVSASPCLHEALT